MAQRTFGWIQNPSDFNKLRRVVAIFHRDSSVYKELVNGKLEELVQDETLLKEMINSLTLGDEVVIKYNLLKGKGPGGVSRKIAKCSGIAQAVIKNQSGRPYSDDWTADGFARWAISAGLLDYDINDDNVRLSELGREWLIAKDPEKKEEVLTSALLSMPPVTRVLNLLEGNGTEPMTKFEIGSQLGGLGEPGFTSYPQELFIQTLCSIPTAKERNKFKSNFEGTSDKYARMIAKWLINLKLVQKISIEKSCLIGGKAYKAELDAYSLTSKGKKYLKRVNGGSSVRKITKIVYWHMLATKVNDLEYIRNRRAFIILSLMKDWQSLDAMKSHLAQKGLEETVVTIADELKVIEAMGISIQKNVKGEYRTTDQIAKLEIPYQTKPMGKTELTEIKDRMRDKLKNINHKYLSLIELSYDGKANRDFELLTIELLTNELQFEGLHLGGGRRPDGLVFYLKKYGIIIDTKAYKDGFNIPISQADEMIRYLNENKLRDKGLNPNAWWQSFEKGISLFYYLFVTSELIGSFEQRLKYICDITEVKGGGITSVNLLYLAEWLKEDQTGYDELPSLFNNDEICIQEPPKALN